MEQVDLKELHQFIDEYNHIISKKEYLSKPDMEQFIHKYQKILRNISAYQKILSPKTFASFCALQKDTELTWVDTYNKQVASYKILSEKEYFENLYIKEKIPIVLDQEQKEIAVTDSTVSLVIAGAGTGKTTTLLSKIKYLVDVKHVDSEKILFLTYTNKTVQKLKKQLFKTFQIKHVDISSFMMLGYRILEKQCSNTLEVITEEEQKKIIFEYIRNRLYRNSSVFRVLIRIYSDLFTDDFKENYRRFSTYQEYFNNYMERKWDLEKDHIEKYIGNIEIERLYKESIQGLDGNLYHTRKDAMIANWLYKHCILFEYGKSSNLKFLNHPKYSSNFIIELRGKTFVFECFDSKSENLKEEALKACQKQRLEKARELKRRGVEFVAIDLENEEIERKLKRELTSRGGNITAKSEQEIFQDLIKQCPEAEFERFLDEIQTNVMRLKENGSTIHTFSEMIEYYQNNSKNQREFQRQNIEVLFMEEVYLYYQTRLKEARKVDYSDILYEAYYFLAKSKESPFPYEYVLVDEYQEISWIRFLLMRQLVKNCKARLIVAGDDWQTINSNAGSNIYLFYDFKKYFPKAKVYNISHNYRSGQELVQIAENFISKNPEQLQKSWISNRAMKSPVEIIYYRKLQFLDTLCMILDSMKRRSMKDEIYILARKKATVDTILRDQRFRRISLNQVIYNRTSLRIKVMTIHEAKGNTCDRAIIVDLENEVFPSSRMANTLFYSYYKDAHIQRELYPFSEERRLFYVALTRAKTKVYVMTLENVKEQSIFVQELKENADVAENRDYLSLGIELLDL